MHITEYTKNHWIISYVWYVNYSLINCFKKQNILPKTRSSEAIWVLSTSQEKQPLSGVQLLFLLVSNFQTSFVKLYLKFCKLYLFDAHVLSEVDHILSSTGRPLKGLNHQQILFFWSWWLVLGWTMINSKKMRHT